MLQSLTTQQMQWVDKTLNGLSLEESIGQLLCVSNYGETTEQWLKLKHPTIKLPRMRPGVGKNGSLSWTPGTTFSVAVSAC